MNRRSFLTALSALPFCNWLKPSAPVKLFDPKFYAVSVPISVEEIVVLKSRQLGMSTLCDLMMRSRIDPSLLYEPKTPDARRRR